MSERKAMAMALVERALQAPEYDETVTGPAQDEEFVLAHADNVEAAGFVSHLKLPHYVDFQAELELLKRLQQEAAVTTNLSRLQLCLSRRANQTHDPPRYFLKAVAIPRLSGAVRRA
ncbi:Bacterial phosphonate metabolism protein (PhnI) [Citrobacter koseri]|uniref:Bacterial phosphonate metabolism protein (PhnI) n=1 Tax=Citrobacter koseri TaxID=545 RepID=A0A2X2V4H9_CITKO|nr:Bacterial phosphonate metabolism protein (PhnI) [Citrobacter koseri]